MGLDLTGFDRVYVSEHVSGLLKLFCCGAKLEFSPCSEVIHGSTTFKLAKGSQKL